MHSQLPPIYYIIFTGITCFGVLMQAFVLLGMFLVLKRTMDKMHAVTEELRPHLLPAVSTARNIIEESAPRIKVAVNDVVEMTHKVRIEVDHVSATVDDLLKKANAQANRVDEMVTASIDSASHATHAVQHAFSVPVRQASALFAGLKAGFEVLRRKNHSERPPEDEYCE
jgi:methyl-accepting chemotaxis protein